MKKILFTLLFATLFGGVAQAQFLVGGGAQAFRFVDRANYPEIHQRVLALSPRLAFVQGNWWFGADALLSRQKSRFSQSDQEGPFNVFTNVSAGPFVRYVKKMGQHTGLWAEASVAASYSRVKVPSILSYESKSWGGTAALRPGVIFFFGRHLSFEASLGGLSYSKVKTKGSQSAPTLIELNSRSQLLDLSLNNNFGFAVNWLF